MKATLLQERSPVLPQSEPFRDGGRAIATRALPLSPTAAVAIE